MNQALIINALLIAAGLYFGIRNLRLLASEDKLRNYITTSPKARGWVQKYGVDESIKMARRTTVPIGLVVALAMFCFGLWNLWQIYR